MQLLCAACNNTHDQAAPCGSTGLTLADLRSLEAAIASGALKVKYRDQEITYASFEELQRRYDFVRKAICGPGSGRARSTKRVAAFNSGRGDCCAGGNSRGNRWIHD